jgi:UDP-N-acetylmuramate--alanine ligase
VRKESVHFIGVGGIGMSALARILHARGQPVSGSDLKDSALIEALRGQGIDVTIGHDAANLDGARTVVVSSAIGRRNPEYAAAVRLGIPILHRGELLAQLLTGRRGIAVCGTHGKTTTTAMTHAVLRLSGIDAGLVLGGIDGLSATNAHDGTSEWFVTEADESDGSFALLEPEIAIVTNIENDHLTSDDELPQLVRAFGEFLAKLPEDGAAIVGVDNELSASLLEHDLHPAVTTFGTSARADVRAANVRFEGFGSSFEVLWGNDAAGTVELRVPGTVNVENALAAIATARHLEIPFPSVVEALAAFRGVRRRFDILASTTRMTVVDDYAHHPTAVRATISAARNYHDGPIVAAFQPHRYTRTAFLARHFAEALLGADQIYLTPIYAASEPAIPQVSERSIGEPLRAAGADVRYVAEVDDLDDRLFNETPDGSLVLMLGAGNITEVAARLAQRILATTSLAGGTK